jgi:putative redox protein
MANVTAKIERTPYATTLRNDTHTLLADEPVEDGGGNTGFTPDELLAASLASCTSITLRMYADRKGWPLESIEVSVNFERDPVTKTGSMLRKIKLFGTLDDEQKSRLLQIADKCPIHQTLTHSISIQSALI